MGRSRGGGGMRGELRDLRVTGGSLVEAAPDGRECRGPALLESGQGEPGAEPQAPAGGV